MAAPTSRTPTGPRTFSRFPLDFIGPASLGASMDDTTRDQIRTVFADLTGLMEDAASQAVAGQIPGITKAEAMRAVRSMDPLLDRAKICLRDVEALVGQGGPKPGPNGQ